MEEGGPKKDKETISRQGKVNEIDELPEEVKEKIAKLRSQIISAQNSEGSEGVSEDSVKKYIENKYKEIRELKGKNTNNFNNK